jgi:hypothetical protein
MMSRVLRLCRLMCGKACLTGKEDICNYREAMPREEEAKPHRIKQRDHRKAGGFPHIGRQSRGYCALSLDPARYLSLFCSSAILTCFLPSQRLTKNQIAAMGAAIRETPASPRPNQPVTGDDHAAT